MRVPRARFLHVLVLAPVAAMLAGVLGPTPRALAASTRAPAPIVITVDPAFGGQPTAAHPNMPFDPGAIGVNGVLEKDVDLDVGIRLAVLLRADLVHVVMTRSSDVYVSATQRQHISTAHHAVMVVSILANSSSDAKTAGALVTYPSSGSRAFAQTLSDALGAQLTSDGVPNLGIVADPKAWPGSRVPAASVKMASLSNASEAALMTTAAFRDDVAAAIRNGLEAYMPAIVARRNAIIAWRDAHPGPASPSLQPASASIPEGTGFQFQPLILWLALIAVAGATLLWREQVARVLVILIALVGRMFGGVLRLRRAAIRRRRRRHRTAVTPSDVESGPTITGYRAAATRGDTVRTGGSVYDDIPL